MQDESKSLSSKKDNNRNFHLRTLFLFAICISIYTVCVCLWLVACEFSVSVFFLISMARPILLSQWNEWNVLRLVKLILWSIFDGLMAKKQGKCNKLRSFMVFLRSCHLNWINEQNSESQVVICFFFFIFPSFSLRIQNLEFTESLHWFASIQLELIPLAIKL